MKETIQSNPTYATWKVDIAPHAADKGENRLAVNNRATIIEIGFHSNAEDAAAMQSSTFRKLAVAGMAKGIRLYDEGKECATFKIDSIPTVSGPIGTPFDYNVNYSGNPSFPITQHFEPVKCESGWTCSKGTRTTTSVSSPLTFQISCRGNTTAAGTFVYKRWLVDADGVKTTPVEHTYTCTPPA